MNEIIELNHMQMEDAKGGIWAEDWSMGLKVDSAIEEAKQDGFGAALYGENVENLLRKAFMNDVNMPFEDWYKDNVGGAWITKYYRNKK